MQKTTPDNILQLSTVQPSLYNPAILADPDFVAGFQAGVESFEDMCDDEGRALTAAEVNSEIWDNISPARRAASNASYAAFGMVERPLFDAGFLAGFIYAHWLTPAPSRVPSMQHKRQRASAASTPATPADASPETQPLPAVLSFRPRGQAEPPSEQASIRYHRQLRGWSQVRLATELGTDEDTVSRWELGRRKPSPYYCERLCAVFHVTADKLGLM